MKETRLAEQRVSREVDSHGNCSKCGGTHYGSLKCPYTSEEIAAWERLSLEDGTLSSSRSPEAGTKWFRPNSRGVGFVVNHPAETRHVIDRNLGGDVFFVSGRLTRFAHRQRCTLSEWLDWAHDAKQVKA